LTSRRNTIESISGDEGLDGMCGATDDVPDYTEYGCSHYHPFATEDIREASKEEKSDSRAKDPGGANPSKIS
jgi:hypothetical protein